MGHCIYIMSPAPLYCLYTCLSDDKRNSECSRGDLTNVGIWEVREVIVRKLILQLIVTSFLNINSEYLVKTLTKLVLIS